MLKKKQFKLSKKKNYLRNNDERAYVPFVDCSKHSVDMPFVGCSTSYVHVDCHKVEMSKACPRRAHWRRERRRQVSSF